MFKIVQIIGTRPQYEKLIHFNDACVIDTGQHYSPELCQDAPEVGIRLDWDGIRDSVRKCEHLVKDIGPKLIICYGDTFSTFVATLTAKRCGIPLAHIEAGVPYTNTLESRIRRRVDESSRYLFCINEEHTKTIRNVWVGYARHAFVVGDLLYDKFLKEHVKNRNDICLCTIHRRENLPYIVEIFNRLKRYKRVWFFEHPHTKQYLNDNAIILPDNISVMPPCDYKDMIKYLSNVKNVVTDSGGLVREAYWSGVPFEYIGENPWPETRAFGDGHAEDKIRKIVNELL